MDINQINNHLNNIKKLTQESNKLNVIFEQTMLNALKNAPESEKEKIIQVRNTSLKAFDLARKGDVSKAIELTKSYTNGG